MTCLVLNKVSLVNLPDVFSSQLHLVKAAILLSCFFLCRQGVIWYLDGFDAQVLYSTISCIFNRLWPAIFNWYKGHMQDREESKLRLRCCLVFAIPLFSTFKSWKLHKGLWQQQIVKKSDIIATLFQPKKHHVPLEALLIVLIKRRCKFYCSDVFCFFVFLS